MSAATRFLTAFAQALATMVLYRPGHPARERAITVCFERLRELQQEDPRPSFSFLGYDVVYGQRSMRDLRDWDWSLRLANAGVQRIELDENVTRDELETFLEEVLARVTLSVIDSSLERQLPTEGGPRRKSIKFGAIGVKGMERPLTADEDALPTATIRYTLGEEAETIKWMHEEVRARGALPLIEAEAVVRSLAVAMHGESEIVMPLVQLKEFDQYTTTHSLNVSVLTMALAEFMGLSGQEVRAFGVAGLLHDLGKVRIPKEVLTKPGRLTEREWEVMRQHPVDGARIIIESDRQLDLASVVAYEHHIMINGHGYPEMRTRRDCHKASKLVHVCDVYDALRTRRPYRDAWEAERALQYMTQRSGTDFDNDIMIAFTAMMRTWEPRIGTLEEHPLAIVREESRVAPATPTSVAAVPEKADVA